jgi:hypothetical protein
MRALAFVASLLLAVVLPVTLVLTALSLTLTPETVSSALHGSGACETATPVLPVVIANWAGVDSSEGDRARYKNVLQRILTPEYVCQELDRTLGEFGHLLQGGADRAELHMEELPALARTKGLQLPAEGFESIEANSTELHPYTQLLRLLRRTAWTASSVSMLLLAGLLAWRRRTGTSRGAASALLFAAVVTIAAILGVARLAETLRAGGWPLWRPLGIDFEGSAAQLLPPIRQLGLGLLSKLEQRLAVAAVGTAALGVVLFRRRPASV